MEQTPHPLRNPNELNRKKNRLENFDYSQSGYYFITMCTHERICYFGEIVDGEMHYSNAGSLAEAFVSVLHIFNPKVKVLNYVVMPDHVHALIWLTNEEADQRCFEAYQNEIGRAHV